MALIPGDTAHQGRVPLVFSKMRSEARKMSKFSEISRIAANVSLCILALVIAGSLAKDHLWGPVVSADQRTRAPQVISLNPPVSDTEPIVLALRSGCPYCTKSAPLYRKLIDQARAKNRKIIAILPDEPEKAREYLRSLGLQIDDVRQADLQAMSIQGTPTLLVLNRTGNILKIWYGQQPEAENEKILKDIFASSKSS